MEVPETIASSAQRSDVPADSSSEIGAHSVVGGSPRSWWGGRNLPVAIGVSVTLAAVVIISLYAKRPVFGIGVVGAAVCIGMWELVRALRADGVPVPMLPLLVGGPIMVAAAYLRGIDGLSLALVLTIVAVLVWLVAEDAPGYLHAFSGATLVIVYVPLLAAFASLLAAPDDGARRVIAAVAATACSDVGGYAFGAKFGRHPMAPAVSPKKSWEGFAGGTAACLAFGGALVPRMFGLPVWQGLLFGAVVVIAATAGDLAESLMKRDLGIKDMSELLPGHGGLLDRIDSLLFVAPVAWLMLSAWAPVPT